MNLRELEYLVAVADHGTFGRAAEACGVSQPTLSVQVRKLETELGVPLLERGARSTGLTPEGQRVVQYAREILLQVAQIEQVGRDDHEPLRIGIFPTLAQYLLPHVTAQVRAACAAHDVHWVERKSAKLFQQLLAGTLDAVILSDWADPGPDVVVTELFSERFVLAAPGEHVLAHSPAEVVLADLVDVPLVLLDDGHCLRDQVVELCSKSGAAEASQVRASSLETLRHMVAAGVGPTLLPYLATVDPAPSLAQVALRYFSEPAPTRGIQMLWRNSARRSQELALIADGVRSGAHIALAKDP